ncbi:MAG: hypothetical protein HY067_03695 [Betaproteobacteria bacterium]|nr:hypothetical protein [Betaproteobacteria bacterium]
MENGKQRVDFSLNGNDKCVMIDDKIHCQPMPRTPIRVASSTTERGCGTVVQTRPSLKDRSVSR